MNGKTITVLICIFLIQLTFSCNPCNCGDAGTYNINYESISLTGLDTSGFYNRTVADSVHKIAFALSLKTNYESIKIAQLKTKKNGFGFSTAMACDCVPIEYNFIDPITSIIIIATDINSSEEKNVSSYFTTIGRENSDSELIDLDELTRYNYKLYNEYFFELVEIDSIPSSVIFEINMTLESGITFSGKSNQVNFFD